MQLYTQNGVRLTLLVVLLLMKSQSDATAGRERAYNNPCENWHAAIHKNVSLNMPDMTTSKL